MNNIQLPEDAFLILKMNYFSKEKPSFKTCYQRLVTIAEIEGWQLPSEKEAKAQFKALVLQDEVEYRREHKRLTRRWKRLSQQVVERLAQEELSETCNRETEDESEFEQGFMQAVAKQQQPQAVETLTSEQYSQLQKFQRMANDLLQAIDEAFPEKTKEAAPIARRKQFASLPRDLADSVARFRSEVALVARSGFVKRGELS